MAQIILIVIKLCSFVIANGVVTVFSVSEVLDTSVILLTLVDVQKEEKFFIIAKKDLERHGHTL